jgi:hypothetical protein
MDFYSLFVVSPVSRRAANDLEIARLAAILRSHVHAEPGTFMENAIERNERLCHPISERPGQCIGSTKTPDGPSLPILRSILTSVPLCKSSRRLLGTTDSFASSRP